MYFIIGTPHTILDLKHHQREFTANDRQRVQIAIIDDEELPYLDILKRHDFNIRQFKDIEDVQAVNNYSVVLCDIRGVGRHFNSKFEGAHLISEIRKRYPAKILLAYTAHQTDPTYNKLLGMADRVVKKDMDSDSWVEILDESITEASDPISQWKRLRDFLLRKDIPLKTLMALEDEYVIAVLNNKDEPFKGSKRLNGLPEEVKKALLDLTKGIVISVLTGNP